MATNPLKIYIDRQAKALVPYLGSVTVIPPLFQSNVLDLEVYFLDPTGALMNSATYSLVEMGAFGLRVAIGPPPTGASGGPTPLAIQTGFVWDAANKKFVGSLALNTTEVDAYIGALTERQAYFEVNLTNGANRDTRLQIGCTLKAVVDEQTSTSPTPADSYLTKNEILATLLKKQGDPGDVNVLVSPNGQYARELGVNDDGSARDNIIQLF